MKSKVVNMSAHANHDNHEFDQKDAIQKRGSVCSRRNTNKNNSNNMTSEMDQNRSNGVFESEPITFRDLDNLADLFKKGNTALAIQLFSVLNITEKFYVGLASNRVDLLQGKSIAYAFNRIGSQWQKELIIRHQYD